MWCRGKPAWARPAAGDGAHGYSTSALKTSLTHANGSRRGFEYDGFDRFRRLRHPAGPRGSGAIRMRSDQSDLNVESRSTALNFKPDSAVGRFHVTASGSRRGPSG